MARCDSTGKFETEDLCDEPEEESLEVDDDGTVSACVRIWKECGGCSSETHSLSLEMEESVDEDEHTKHREGYTDDDGVAHAACEGVLSVQGDGWSVVDEMQNKDRHGKPIKSFRYMKRLVGAEGIVHVKCDECSFEYSDVELKETDAASSMEEQGH